VIYGTFGGKGREGRAGESRGEPETEIADKPAFVSVIKLMNERVYRRVCVSHNVYRTSLLRLVSLCARYHFGSEPRFAWPSSNVVDDVGNEGFPLRPRRGTDYRATIDSRKRRKSNSRPSRVTATLDFLGAWLARTSSYIEYGNPPVVPRAPAFRSVRLDVLVPVSEQNYKRLLSEEREKEREGKWRSNVYQ